MIYLKRRQLMPKKKINDVKEEIKIARDYFESDDHFDEIFEMVDSEEEMRMFDCGYAKALEHILIKLQEYKTDE